METNEVGERIRALREARGLKPGQLAYRSGVDRNYLWYIEKGRRQAGADVLARLASALAVSLDDLLGTVGEGRLMPAPEIIGAVVRANGYPSEVRKRVSEAIIALLNAVEDATMGADDEQQRRMKRLFDQLPPEDRAGAVADLEARLGIRQPATGAVGQPEMPPSRRTATG